MLQHGLDFQAMWAQIQRLVVLSLASVQPLLRQNYINARPPEDDGSACFEVLGYDVLLDHKCKPWLLEVRHISCLITLL